MDGWVGQRINDEEKKHLGSEEGVVRKELHSQKRWEMGKEEEEEQELSQEAFPGHMFETVAGREILIQEDFH